MDYTKTFKKIAKSYSFNNPDRIDDLGQELLLEALEYCQKDKRHSECANQQYFGLKTRLNNKAAEISVNLSSPVRRPDNKRGRTSELKHGEQRSKIDPDIIHVWQIYQKSSNPNPNSRFRIDARYLQNSHARHKSFQDNILERIDLQKLAIPFYTNLSFRFYDRIYLLFDRKLSVCEAAQRLAIKPNTLQKWYDYTLNNRYPNFNHKLRITAEQDSEISRVRRRLGYINAS